MPARAKQAGLPLRLWLSIAAVCLLLQGVLQAAGQVQVSGVTGDASVRYTWSQPTLTVTPDTVNINRGDDVVLTFTSAASVSQETNSVVIKGTVSVIGSNGTGPCDVSSTTGQLVQLRITVDGQSTFVPAARVGSSSPTCVQPSLDTGCSSIPFTMTINSVTAQPTLVTVSAFWTPAAGGAPVEVGSCSAGTGTITYVNPSKAVGETATINQKLTYPDWSSMTISPWLVMQPSVSTATLEGTMPTVVTSSGSSSGATVRASDGGWSARWTVTVSSVQFCLNQPQPITNTVTLSPDNGGGTLQSQSVSVPLQVKGCNLPLGLVFNNPFTRTDITYSWTHSIQATGSTSPQVNWGASAVVPARAVFQRTVTSATFLLTGEMQLTNPENAPVWVQALQIQCPWTTTFVIQCGVSGVGGLGVGFVIPARGTINCPVNQQIPGVWGADMTQPCRIYAQNYWNIETIRNDQVLNFAAPKQWVRINDCVQWSMFCSSPTGGSPRWQARMTGGPTGGGVRICGNDNNAPIPDQDASIAIGGTWTGSGDQPGDCGNAVTATCTSQLSMQNSGAWTQGSTGGGTSTQISVTATPTNCPPLEVKQDTNVVPSPSPADLGPGYRGVNRMTPVTTIRVTNTKIQGAFGWDVSAAVEPASQSIVMGSSSSAKYTVIATRGDAEEGPPVKYIIEGEITLQNTYDKILPISSVNVLLGSAKVPASCAYPNAGLDPQSTVKCTFALLYSLGPTPGSLDVEVAYPDTPVRSNADAQAPFDFSNADVSAASGLCASVNMSFAANEGMGLVKSNDVGATPLRVDGQGVRVCGTTQFAFDVAYNPNLPLSCGPQLVLGTAMVMEDETGKIPPHSAVAIATINVTCGGSLLDSNNGGSAASAPVPAGETGSGVTVTLGDVNTKPVENVVWTLRLNPNGLTGNKVTKPADGSVDLKFDVVHSRSVETMTGYSGDVRIVNGGSTPLKVDSVTVELIDQLSGDSNTVAQIAGSCSVGEASSNNLLEVAPGATATCSYELKAKLGGQVVATITAVDVPDAIQSAGKSVQSLLSNGVTEGCAQLVTGLGASTLVPDGRVMAGGGELLQNEVCQTGRTQVLYTIGATEAPCGTYPFLAAAAITQSADTTAPIVTASAAVDIEVTGCSGAAPEAASLSLVRSYKTRLMQWSVKKQATPPIDGAFKYVAGGDNTVNVTVLFSRQLKTGQQVSVAGTGSVNTGSRKPVFGRSRIVLMPLCTEDSCVPIQITPSCNPNVTEGAFTCRFQADKLPVAPGLVLPLMYAAADQAWPHTAKAVVYDPSNSSGRRTLGRCAVLTDSLGITGGPFDKPPAAVRKQNEINPLPTAPVCASSFLYSYEAQFSGVVCGDATVDYSFTSQAKAAPSDTAGGVATGSLDFTVSC